MLKKIKKSIDTIFRFVLSLNETKRNETKRTYLRVQKNMRKEGNHWFNCSPNPYDRGCMCLNIRGGYYGAWW